eukprot:531148-Pelagomonas_calceolata.AAC.2
MQHVNGEMSVCGGGSVACNCAAGAQQTNRGAAAPHQRLRHERVLLWCATVLLLLRIHGIMIRHGGSSYTCSTAAQTGAAAPQQSLASPLELQSRDLIIPHPLKKM